MKKITFKIEYDLGTGSVSYLGTTTDRELKELLPQIGRTERKFLAQKIKLFMKSKFNLFS
jgi:hypothetical protein